MAKTESVPASVESNPETVRIRFAKENGTNPKAPVASYFLSLSGPLSGLSLKGSIFKGEKDGSYTVNIPGGRNFGGIFGAEANLAEVNGRTIAVVGEFDEVGARKMSKFEDIIRTAFYGFLTDPAKNTLQNIRF